MSHKIYDSNADRQEAYRARLRRKACDAYWANYSDPFHQKEERLQMILSAHKRGYHRSRLNYVGHKQCPLCQNAELLTVTPPRIPVTVRGASNGN